MPIGPSKSLEPTSVAPTTPSESLELIESPVAFEELIEEFSGEPVVGLDTEAASFHRFHDRIYLLQLSSPTRTVVVDPLAVGGLSPLAPWLARPTTEFVFHDADYDIRLLHHEFALRVARLFDTRIAAQFLNLPSIGLAGILEARFGIATNKKWQRADWSARPLSPEMVRYAATDTRYLPQLRDAFRSELSAVNRLSWVEEECELARKVEWSAAAEPGSGFLRVRGARELDRRGLAVLRELFAWREETAERLDRALFRVLGNEALLGLAGRRPRTLDALESIRGVGKDTTQRRGQQLLDAIERGLAVPEAELPRFERRPRYRPDPAFERRLESLRQWRVGLAARLSLPPGVLAPNATLEGVARANPRDLDGLVTVPGMRRWQAAEFGAELLAALASAAG